MGKESYEELPLRERSGSAARHQLLYGTNEQTPWQKHSKKKKYILIGGGVTIIIILIIVIVVSTTVGAHQISIDQEQELFLNFNRHQFSNLEDILDSQFTPPTQNLDLKFSKSVKFKSYFIILFIHDFY